MKPIFAFGEIMARISMPGFRRISQSLPGSVDIEFAGAEANVLTSLSMLGGATSFVTALPINEIGKACLTNLLARGVGLDHVVHRANSRLGLYFVEKGANQRPGLVVYDRDGSAIATTPSAEYRWTETLAHAGWLHLTGITPGLSALAAEANLEAARTASQMGIPVSCDLNYRSKLWRWDPTQSPEGLAAREMDRVLPHITHLIAGREDAAVMLGIRPRVSSASGDAPSREVTLDVITQLVERFPRLQAIAMTQRQGVSAHHHFWGGCLYTVATREDHWAPRDADGRYSPYEIDQIVDRIGGGDAFSAGLIFAWHTPELADPGTAIRFATAASCLAHSIEGDANWVTRHEVESLMAGSTGGRVRR
ncbi:MAG: PfkB family carbohydrate kinase [Limisphaerales bacterium]